MKKRNFLCLTTLLLLFANFIIAQGTVRRACSPCGTAKTSGSAYGGGSDKRDLLYPSQIPVSKPQPPLIYSIPTPTYIPPAIVPIIPLPVLASEPINTENTAAEDIKNNAQDYETEYGNSKFSINNTDSRNNVSTQAIINDPNNISLDNVQLDQDANQGIMKDLESDNYNNEQKDLFNELNKTNDPQSSLGAMQFLTEEDSYAPTYNSENNQDPEDFYAQNKVNEEQNNNAINESSGGISNKLIDLYTKGSIKIVDPVLSVNVIDGSVIGNKQVGDYINTTTKMAQSTSQDIANQSLSSIQTNAENDNANVDVNAEQILQDHIPQLVKGGSSAVKTTNAIYNYYDSHTIPQMMTDAGDWAKNHKEVIAYGAMWVVAPEARLATTVVFGGVALFKKGISYVAGVDQ